MSWKGTLLGVAPAIILVALGSLSGNMGLGLLGVLASAMVAWRIEGGGRTGWRVLGFVTPPSPGRTVGIGLGTFVAMHVLLGGIFLPLFSRLFGPADLSAFDAIRGHPERLVLMLAIALVNGGLAEEIVFRGFLFRRLETHAGGGRRGMAIAFAVSALVFGVGHAYQGMTGVAGTTIAGLVFAAAYVMDRRILWAAVIGHAVYDWSGILWLYFN